MGICDMDIDIDIDILIYTCVCIYVHSLCFIHSIRKTKQVRTMLSDTVCVWGGAVGSFDDENRAGSASVGVTHLKAY